MANLKVGIFFDDFCLFFDDPFPLLFDLFRFRLVWIGAYGAHTLKDCSGEKVALMSLANIFEL